MLKIHSIFKKVGNFLSACQQHLHAAFRYWSCCFLGFRRHILDSVTSIPVLVLFRNYTPVQNGRNHGSTEAAPFGTHLGHHTVGATNFHFHP